MLLSIRRVHAAPFRSISFHAALLASAISATGALAEEIVVNQTGDYTLNRATPITGTPRVIDITTDGMVTLTLNDVTATSAVANGVGISVADSGAAAVIITAGNVITSGSGQAQGISVTRGFTGSTTINATSVTTSGSASDAINVRPGAGSTTTVTVGAVTTTGAGSSGIVLSNNLGGGDLIVNAGSVNVSGSAATGIYAFTMAGSAQVTADDVTVADGRGIFADGTTSATVTARNVSTGGFQGIAIHAVAPSGGPVSVTTTGAIRTTGAIGYGIYSVGGKITDLNSGTITTTGDGGVGILATSTASGITITNSGAIKTSGGVTTDGSTTVQSNGIWAVARTGPIVIDNRGSITTTGASASAIVVESGSGVTSFGFGGGQGGPISLTNSGTITTSGANASAVTIANGGNAATLDNSGTITGKLSFTGAGSDTLTNSGSITGNVDLGAGDDTLTLQGAWALQGTASGGAGNDTLRLAAPTGVTPFETTGSAFTSFETTNFIGGTVAINGSIASAANIQAGYVFGRAGSTMTGNVSVASGATFGSAGTVIGNITVAGTLSPGASPGTMTVTGNVSLAGSSTSLFEITPTTSDQLLISGTLSIASGATLTLTGTRPLTPGVTLDLVTASGGITGSFTTINKASTIQGFVSQSATKLSLLGTFLTGPGFTPQVNSTIGYVNNVLIAGQASPALLAAIPSLLTSSGASNPAIFQQMSPEAYASASQLGTEQALTLVAAARAQIMTRPTANGLFTFGQALYNHRDMDGDAARGISSGRMQTYGGLAGIGLASDNGWIGAFVGYLDGRQTIAGLGVRTDADGIMAGVQGAWQSGAFQIDGLIGYSGGNADTRRTLLAAPLSGHYALRSWIGDARASYGLAIGAAWSLRPSLGLTAIRTTRGAVVESGNSPFALAVAQDASTRWFLDGDLMIERGQADGSAFRPFAAIGVQRRLEGRESAAAASLTGVTTSYRLPGLERERTVATARIGMNYDLTERLSLFATYAGEFSDETRHNGSVGLRLAI